MPPDPIRPDTSGIPLVDLARLLGTTARWANGTDISVTGVTLDSRSVLPGDLYAALPGFNVHGAGFVADAIAHGAVAVLTDPAGAKLFAAGEPAVPVLVVATPRAILGSVASAVYGNPSADLTMIGITGTNGKTTIAHLIDAALRCHGHRTGLIGTVETRIGDVHLDSVRTTPETTDLHAILAVMRQCDIDDCVMEVSSHALALHRVDGVRYDVVLFTNLSQDHLDFHHSMEEYFGAKAALFTAERASSAVVCVDDEWGARLAAGTTIPVTTLSTAVPATVHADWQVRSDADGAFSLTRVTDALTLDLVSHLPGTFNVANAALAALALLECGIEPADVAAAMASPPAVPGRMEVVVDGGAGLPRCIVDFAHTPDAVDAALAALRPSTTGRLIAVLGAGGDRDHGKRPAMGAAAARRADVVVVTDDNPRSEDPAVIRSAVADGARGLIDSGKALARKVIDGGSRYIAITEAIAMAIIDAETRATGAGPARTDPVDTVVVLGKGHEKGQEIHGVIHPFDDRAAVRAAIEAASGGGARP